MTANLLRSNLEKLWKTSDMANDSMVLQTFRCSKGAKIAIF
jgi:hypothetical protein